MLPLNHVINSTTFLLPNIITTSSVYHPLIVSKQRRRRRRQQQPPPQRARTRRTTTTTTSTPFAITTIPLPSVNTRNNTASLSISTLSTQQQLNTSLEESYSPKTGIKTAALLGGMSFLLLLMRDGNEEQKRKEIRLILLFLFSALSSMDSFTHK